MQKTGKNTKLEAKRLEFKFQLLLPLVGSYYLLTPVSLIITKWEQ